MEAKVNRARPKRRPHAAYTHRVQRKYVAHVPDSEVALDCGWGRLLFAQTYPDARSLAAALAQEGPERRDIASWVRDPHLVLAAAPQALFLDPSNTYRLDLSTYRGSRKRPRGFVVRWVTSQADADAVNRIYLAHRMVTVPAEFMFSHRDSRTIVYLVAEDEVTQQVIGTVTGVDHLRAFGDP